MTKPTRYEKRKHMLDLIEAYENSGQTQKSFCDENDLKMPVFQYWLRKYRKSDSTNKPASFIPIEVDPPRESPGAFACVIEYPDGTILRLAMMPDTRTLAQLARLARI